MPYALPRSRELSEALRMTLPDGRIGHAELAIGNAVISVGLALEPGRDGGAPVTRTTLRTMTLVFVDDVDEAVAKGTRYGGSIIDPADRPAVGTPSGNRLRSRGLPLGAQQASP
jgi:PhnB protein